MNTGKTEHALYLSVPCRPVAPDLNSIGRAYAAADTAAGALHISIESISELEIPGFSKNEHHHRAQHVIEKHRDRFRVRFLIAFPVADDRLYGIELFQHTRFFFSNLLFIVDLKHRQVCLGHLHGKAGIQLSPLL